MNAPWFPSLRAWRKRRQRAAAKARALADLVTTAMMLGARIEQTTASFGADRLFDQRLGRIEVDALTIRKRAEAIASWDESSQEATNA